MSKDTKGSGLTGPRSAGSEKAVAGTDDGIMERARQALMNGEFDLADRLLARGDFGLAELTENLRIYQAELEIQNSELRQAQGQLQLALERFQGVYAHMPIPVLLLDRTGLIQDANEAASLMFSIQLDLLRKHFMRRLFADDAGRLISNALVHAHEYGSAVLPRQPVKDRLGDVRVVDVHFSLLPAEVGEERQFVCVLVDLTETLRQQAELLATTEDLRRSEARYRILADYSPDWEYWLGPDQAYLYVSPACETVCGYPARDFIADPELFCRLLHPEDRDLWHRHVAEMEQCHEESPTQCSHGRLWLRLLHREGGLRWIEHHCTPVWDAEGQYLGRRGVNRDVTQRKLAEAALDRLSGLYATLSAVNQNIVRADDEATMLKDVCAIAVDKGGLKAAVISLVDETGNHVYPLAWVGMEQAILDDLPWHAEGEASDGLVPPGQAWFSQKSCLCQDCHGAELSRAWQAWARRAGMASCAHYPLHRDGRLHGLASFFSEAPGFFTDDIARLLNEMALDIASGMDRFAMLRRQDEDRHSLARQRAHLSALLDGAPIGIGMLVDRVILDVNEQFCLMIGYSKAELNHESARILYDDEHEYNRVGQEKYAQIRAQGRGQIETRFRRKDGAIIDVLITSVPLNPEDLGQGVVFTALDITQHKQAETRLRLVGQLFESSSEGMLVTDADGNIQAINQAFAGITGYGEADALGKTPRILKSGRHDAAFYQQMWTSLRESGQWRGEIWNRRKNGEIFPEWETISSVLDDHGRVSHYVSVFSDITDVKQSQQTLEYMAHHDPLTGLPNRSLFRVRLEHSMQRAVRTGGKLALLYLDLDRFKNVNNTLGHSVGDELLRHVAASMTEAVRGVDTIARLGGDEFVLILEDIDSSHAASVGARKLLDLFHQPHAVDDREFYVTASIGISIFPQDGEDVDTLVRNADVAMYQAKNQGRNTFQFYEQAMTRGSFERLEMETALRGALERHEFEVYYQPQVDMQGGSLVGAEALIRWQHPQLGLVSPARFIPLAEEIGLIDEIGLWVLGDVCRQIRAWEEVGFALPVAAVNLSVRQLERVDLVERIAAMIQGAGIPPGRIKLEITESMIMSQTGVAQTILQELQRLGIAVAVDDFGTGYSSLGYLKRLPLNQLKIDQSFVQDIGHDVNDEAITRAVIAMGDSLGLEVLAEGVEREEQKGFLIQEGCRLGQGYLFGKPMPAAQFLAAWHGSVPGSVS